MSEATTISERMNAVRNRGLVNARELGQEVERLGDWREHVRANPLPLALAAAVAGFWLVPARRPKPVVVKQDTEVEEKAKVAGAAGLGGAAMGFVGSMLGNLVRNYVSHQLQSMLHGKDDDHAPFIKRQATYRD
jgi:hypothetical protein